MIVVGVSGGIDSMVLLDVLYKQNKKIVIAHVNYQKRIDSNKDLECIKKYIKDKEDIKLHVLKVEEHMYTNDNFQSQARKIRYDFYQELCHKYNTNQVYLAHHLDDSLETYLFKKQRKGLYHYYGIKSNEIINDMHINRILINKRKKDIIKYASENKIEYHEDSSNKTLVYTRNIIRNKLSKLDDYQISILLKMMEIDNYQILIQKTFQQKIEKDIYLLDEFNKYPIDIKRRIIYDFFMQYDISTKEIDNIIKQIMISKNFEIIKNNKILMKAYNKIYLLHIKDNYNLEINNQEEMTYFNEELKKDGFDLKLEFNQKIKIKSLNLIEDNLFKKQTLKKLKNKKISRYHRQLYPIIILDNDYLVYF